MGLKGYALAPKDQAEDERASFAAGQQGPRPPRPFLAFVQLATVRISLRLIESAP